jgi:hypothetical protein
MRFLLKARPDRDRINQHIKDGSFGQRMQQVLSELKPEATYFLEEAGQRTVILILDLQQTSDIPKVAEPFFFMGADVFIHPVMTPQDLANANLDELGRRWGGSQR